MHVTCVDSNRSDSRVRLLVKQRFGYGLDYRLLVIMRGNNPRTLVCPMLSS